ncbi:MAG: NAD+ synthase [Actinomycetota bacterium]|nr:NAD+ synthase [Actinomycetota bacterium]
MARLRLALCQIDSVVGDLEGNAGRVLSWLGRAEEARCDLAVFPELALTGYPPEDLLLKPGFVRRNLELMEKLASATGECAAVVGFVDASRDLHNAVGFCAGGSLWGSYHKQLLPNYAVFDEQRYFVPGTGATRLYRVGGVSVGMTVCEDAWAAAGPISDQAARGAELVLSCNASPFSAGRLGERRSMLSTRAADASCALAYVNMVGGQDELLFDGGSMVFDANGELVASAEQFVEDMLVVDLEIRPVFRKRLLDPRGRATAAPLEVGDVSANSRSEGEPPVPRRHAAVRQPAAELYEALVLGTRDYVRKNGFADVVIGLSGGVDSSLVAAVAADAVGAAHVHGVSMPSRYSSPGSLADAGDLAERLGIDYRTIAIEQVHSAFEASLAGSFEGLAPGLAEENLQSRARGVILMALSNKFGWIVLTTGNKSELAVGYSTLYGDSAGGFAVLKDVLKTTVYRLCDYRNGVTPDRPPIPPTVLAKPPSAELRPDQRDDQSLPPYDVLDPVLEAYVENDCTASELVSEGVDPAVVNLVVRLVDAAEYKRRQYPPGVRVTGKAFGKDRRVPITNHFR